MGEHTLSEIDAEMDTPSNTERIEVLDRSGDVMDIKKGFVYQTGCQKQKDYVVGREEIDTGNVDEEGNAIMDYEDITGTVIVIYLTKSDLRKEVESLKEIVGELVTANSEK